MPKETWQKEFIKTIIEINMVENQYTLIVIFTVERQATLPRILFTDKDLSFSLIRKKCTNGQIHSKE